MKQITLFCLSLLFTLPALAQEVGRIDFEEQVYDFGDIKEDGPLMSHTFVFKNRGNAPLRVTDVQADCGCTTPHWSKVSVDPGEVGQVRAVYDPMMRPGSFDKKVTVYTNGEPKQVILRIKGNVLPRTITAEDIYFTRLGNLGFVINRINIGDIYDTEVDTKHVAVYNFGREPILFKGFTTSEQIEVIAEPQMLMPDQKGTLIVEYDGKKDDELGFKWEQVMMSTSDPEEPNKPLIVMATLKKAYDLMDPEEMKQAPRISVDDEVKDLGLVTANKVAHTEFVLSNTGNSELVIYEVKSGCGCTVADPVKDKLAPGESVPLKVSYSSKNQAGSQTKDITVWTNDPLKPQLTLTIKANVGMTAN